jgi:glutamate-ammonia-ligase adenylyltransferase
VTGRDVSAVAEAVLETALSAIDPGVPFAVVALGRFGGAALSYASDLDVVFVHGGDGPSAFEAADHAAKQLLRLVNGAAPSDRIFEVDAKLRPEGAQGAMSRSIEGYVQYFDRWAQVWERQAYLRARPVAGDRELGQSLIDALDSRVWDDGLSDDHVREIRRMKARVEKERLPANVDPTYHLKLGRGSLSDVEWTAQLLQLRHGVRAPDTIEALLGLRQAGHLAPDDADTLIETYRFLEHTRNRLVLVTGATTDTLPTQPEPLMWVARSLGTNAADLREDFRRATRRTRRVVERVFYGQG